MSKTSAESASRSFWKAITIHFVVILVYKTNRELLFKLFYFLSMFKHSIAFLIIIDAFVSFLE